MKKTFPILFISFSCFPGKLFQPEENNPKTESQEVKEEKTSFLETEAAKRWVKAEFSSLEEAITKKLGYTKKEKSEFLEFAENASNRFYARYDKYDNELKEAIEKRRQATGEWKETCDFEHELSQIWEATRKLGRCQRELMAVRYYYQGLLGAIGYNGLADLLKEAPDLETLKRITIKEEEPRNE